MSTQQQEYLFDVDKFLRVSAEIQIEEFLKVKNEVKNLRKGIFSRHGELFSAYSAMQEEINALKKDMDLIKNVPKRDMDLIKSGGINVA